MQLIGILLVLAVSPYFAKAQTLTLVSARDELPGGFVGNQAVYADHERIYLGSYQGQLYVLARDLVNDFPVMETLNYPASVTGVLGDDNNLYVIMGSGQMVTYRKTFPLQFVKMVQLPGYTGVESISLVQGLVYVSMGQGEMVADENRVFLSPLNESDVAFMVPNKFGFHGIASARSVSYGRTFLPNATTVYNRQTGLVLGSIPRPGNDQVALFGDATRLFQTVPGPHGTGIWIYNKTTLSLNRFISIPYVNTVASGNMQGKDLLLAGTEGGIVDLLDLNASEPCTAFVNLRWTTGHTGIEDIEIRSLWCDGFDGLVFCGSSNPSSNLPTFFVLKIETR